MCANLHAVPREQPLNELKSPQSLCVFVEVFDLCVLLFEELDFFVFVEDEFEFDVEERWFEFEFERAATML